jgi:streptomycin 6-kinase
MRTTTCPTRSWRASVEPRAEVRRSEASCAGARGDADVDQRHGERQLNDLDPALVAQLREAYGPEVDNWLDALPTLVAEVSQAWGLTDVHSLTTEYVGFSVVLQGHSTQHGNVVVKLVPPGEDGQQREAATLTAWNGRGAVRLLGHDVDRRALLLKRLSPGTPLDVTDDDRATRVIAEVAAGLAVPPTTATLQQLPGLSIWTNDLDAYVATYGVRGPIDDRLIQIARERLDRLLSTAYEPVLLHGDLHHDNVLRDGDDWVAIDPKGYVGDAASEPGQMFFNPIPYVRPLSPDALAGLVERRLDAWARFSSLDPTRVRDWAFVKCVVSDVWSLEDDGVLDGLPSRVGWEILAAERG